MDKILMQAKINNSQVNDQIAGILGSNDNLNVQLNHMGSVDNIGNGLGGGLYGNPHPQQQLGYTDLNDRMPYILNDFKNRV
mmetsp:Transcript_18148/g.31022  ORF Transcript_18148/g.31022 Transcript_18148/m.31022 type:complete len:81 (+) Transcript_18148:446-688(+)|eukprot:CAMPEP_0168608674 /NCGR_PEP_ID=MMETSP0449_2-20121227/768_1 /TAXON_ID=1082188 /ORGANISM="Strombidium rassoulzadegani, Strain ras09" /LENGTH=80 /DNA_ID=CAMNT_0008648705 /DNA_START=296 /DNA_END=538 /DNA_ORIENTATION=-